MKVQVRVVGKYLEPLRLKLQIAESCKCTFDHLCRPFPTQLYTIQLSHRHVFPGFVITVSTRLLSNTLRKICVSYTELPVLPPSKQI